MASRSERRCLWAENSWSALLGVVTREGYSSYEHKAGRKPKGATDVSTDVACKSEATAAVSITCSKQQQLDSNEERQHSRMVAQRGGDRSQITHYYKCY